MKTEALLIGAGLILVASCATFYVCKHKSKAQTQTTPKVGNVKVELDDIEVHTYHS